MVVNYKVDPTTIIDNGAKIGNGTVIWHFSHICGQAVIGEKCSLGQNVFVANNVIIGNNVKIQNNVSVYEGVIIEDDVFCGPSMVFTNIYNPRSHLSRKHEYRKTYVKKGATIGANATLVCGIVVGEYAFIGAGSVVREDVMPYAIMVGVPARHKGYMCRCGLTLKFTSNLANCSCGTSYKLNDSQCFEI